MFYFDRFLDHSSTDDYYLVAIASYFSLIPWPGDDELYGSLLGDCAIHKAQAAGSGHDSIQPESYYKGGCGGHARSWQPCSPRGDAT